MSLSWSQTPKTGFLVTRLSYVFGMTRLNYVFDRVTRSIICLFDELKKASSFIQKLDEVDLILKEGASTHDVSVISRKPDVHPIVSQQTNTFSEYNPPVFNSVSVN